MSEKVDYRYNLYNKDDIHLVLGVTDIVRPYLSAAVKHSRYILVNNYNNAEYRRNFFYVINTKIHTVYYRFTDHKYYAEYDSENGFSNPIEDTETELFLSHAFAGRFVFVEDDDMLYKVSSSKGENISGVGGYPEKISYIDTETDFTTSVEKYTDLADIKYCMAFKNVYVEDEDCLYEPHKNEDGTYEWQKIPSSGLIRSVKTLAELNRMDVSSGDYDGASVYVEGEDAWYFYHPIYKKWLIENSQTYTYAAMFYLEYSNDKLKERAKIYFNPKIAIWKTVEGAKEDLSSMSFSYIDCTADEGRTFFIVDNGQSKLLTPLEQYRQEDISAMYSVG